MESAGSYSMQSADCSRQITTPTPHHSVFYRPDAHPATPPTVSKHWRHNCLSLLKAGNTLCTGFYKILNYYLASLCCVDKYVSCVDAVGTEQVKPECIAWDCRRGADSDVGRHWRLRQRETWTAGVGSVSGWTPRQVSEVWNDTVKGCSVLWAAWLWQNTACQGHCQRVSGKLHLDKGTGAADDVVWRIWS